MQNLISCFFCAELLDRRLNQDKIEDSSPKLKTMDLNKEIVTSNPILGKR